MPPTIVLVHGAFAESASWNGVIAELHRRGHANVIAIGARLVGEDMAKACVAAFLDNDFLGGRHQRRVDQLSQLLQDSD